MLLKKYDSETLKEYKLRLFRNKELYSLSNKDIAELINKASSSNKDESAYRKWFKSYQEGYDDAINSSATSLNYKKERIELAKEKCKIQTEKLELNRWIREQSREELFYDKINDAIKHSIIQIPSVSKRCIYQPNDTDYVLFLADQHYGVDFKIYGLDNEIINEYSPEVFEERMNTIYEYILNKVHEKHINKLSIICLGDTLDGHLRNSQLIKLRWGVIDCAIKYGIYMSQWLSKLSNDVDIDFYNTSGNHTELRLLDGKKGEHERENLDKVIMTIIKSCIKETNNRHINIIENYTGYVYTELPCGHSIFGFHGEEKNLEKAVKDFSSIYDKRIDYIAAGHLHHCNINLYGHRKGTIRVGSIIGCDDYSMKIRRRADASTVLIGLEKNKGLTELYNILLN